MSAICTIHEATAHKKTATVTHIGVARILSGVHFFPKKVDDLFLVIALKDRVNIPPNLSHQAKTVLKFTLALAGGALRVLGVHFHIFR